MEKERVLVDRDILSQYTSSFTRVKELPVPELDGLMKGKAILKVKAASLDDHIRAKSLSSAPILLLASVVSKLMKKEEVDVDSLKKEIFEDGKLHQNTTFEIEIFRRCVLAPDFNIKEVIEISEVFPEVINKVVKYVLGMNQGEAHGGRKAS